MLAPCFFLFGRGGGVCSGGSFASRHFFFFPSQACFLNGKRSEFSPSFVESFEIRGSHDWVHDRDGLMVRAS